MAHSGTSIDALKPSFKKLAEQAEKGSDAFQKLGISEEEVANLSQEDLFARVITGLQGMEAGSERTALASQLLGKGATELGALLNTSAADTEAMRQRVHELGGVMSNEAVKAAAGFEDSLQDMNTAIDGIKRGLMSEFLPSITTVMDGVTELFAGNEGEGLGRIKEGVSQFLENMMDIVPRIMEIGMTIVQALGSAIVENLPAIFEAGTQAIMQLTSGLGSSLPTLIPSMVEAVLTMVNGLLSNTDQLIEAGIQLIVGLAQGLINAIPKIIEALPQIITSLITGLIGAIPQIADAGVQLLSSLIQDLPTIIANIVAAIPQIIGDIVSAIINGVPDLIEAGKNLMTGLANGIKNGIAGAVDAAKSAASSVLGSVKNFFGIASPSKVMELQGRYIDEGLAIGLKKNATIVGTAMKEVNKKVSVKGKSKSEALTIDVAQFNAANKTSASTLSNTQSKNQTVILEIDHMQFARAVFRLYNEEAQRVGLSMAGGY